MMKTQAYFFFLFVLLTASASAGTVTAPPEAVVQEKDNAWSFYASVSGYAVPDDRDYLSPVFTADRGPVHLEARYNYEALDAASVWVGWNFSIGEKWKLDFTPMVGGVFGDMEGLAPGWRLALGRGPFEFTTEAEFVFDAEDSDEDFFYAWSELTWSFTDSFWLGLALQRTRAYETDLDLQRGVLVGFSFRGLDVTGYVFNLGWDDPLYVLTIGYEF